MNHVTEGASPNATRSDPGKYLVVKLGALGDIVHTLPAQQTLRNVRPDCEIHWLAEAPYIDLLRCVPGIDRLWVIDTRKWRSHPGSIKDLVRLVAGLRKERFQAAIDFQGLLKSSLLTSLSGARQRIGFASHQVRERAAGWFYTDALAVVADGRHRIEQSVQLLSAVKGLHNIELQRLISGRVPFQLPDRCREYIDEQFRQFSVTERPVILNPGAGWPTKLWPVSRFTDLAGRIALELERSVVVTWGPGEQELAEEIVSRNSEFNVVAFPTSILELAQLCRKSALMVAADTGPLHLAVAVGTPTVAIMGPTHGWRNGPFNPMDEIVTHSQPCPRPYARRCRDHFCMDIPVNDVFEAIRRRLSRPVNQPSVKQANIHSQIS